MLNTEMYEAWVSSFEVPTTQVMRGHYVNTTREIVGLCSVGNELDGEVQKTQLIKNFWELGT